MRKGNGDWGGSRRTKPCIFPCKVAAGGDERSADRIVVAASRLLGAAAACVILLSFAAGSRK